jgi:hypothetical protein
MEPGGIRSMPGEGMVMAAAYSVGALCLVADFLAVVWFGMWMGLTSKRVSWAVVKTVGLVLVLPWLALMFVRALAITMLRILMGGGGVGFLAMGYFGVVVLEVGISLGFVFLARRQMHLRFRECAAQVAGYSAPVAAPAPTSPAASARP